MPFTLSESEFSELFQTGFRANGLDSLCTDANIRAFYTLTSELLHCAEHMNLTAITDPKAVIIRHYADCAAAVSRIPAGADIADVGTGAGFPSLPFAILRPDITVTAVDATRKKLDYVAGAARLLGLSNLTVHAARAEELGQDPSYREQFDLVCARAVARLNVLSEWCMPLVKKGGVFLAMKGRDGRTEAEEALRAVDVLGGVIGEIYDFSLSDPFAETEEDMRRCLITVKKRQFTPKQYPRPNTQITKKPL